MVQNCEHLVIVSIAKEQDMYPQCVTSCETTETNGPDGDTNQHK